MSVATAIRTSTIALIGNPNTGKSTLFNALCGVRQRVGNYPGVTVEMKLGHLDIDGRRFAVMDLPGTYSLSPRSPDEMIAIDVLLGRRDGVAEPDLVLCIVDAGNLQRNLYLVSQVLELGRPTIIVLNMMDCAESRGLKIEVHRLSAQLGVRVVPMQANRRVGVDALRQAIASAAELPPRAMESPFPPAFQRAVEELGASLSSAGAPLPRYLVERLLLDTSGYLAESHLDAGASLVRQKIAALRERLATEGCQVPGIEAISRYQWVSEVLDGVVVHPGKRPVTLSDRIDRMLTHKVIGSAVFLLLMAAMFQSIFTIGRWSNDWADSGVGTVGDFLSGHMADGALRSMIVDGVVAGVGNVLVFLPQIFLLFLFIAVLEDCGYMARAAYLMDKLMSRVGLSGKSFIPLLSSFACAIPGIMSARVIENRRDRLITVLVAPLMSCSARLPVYLLLTAAIIPDRNVGVLKIGSLVFWSGLNLQTITLMAMYLLGVVAAVVVALLLRRTLLRGVTPPFVMELPAYKVPGVSIVSWRAGERAWEFIYRAGTMIFAVSVIVWAAGYYPRHAATIDAPHAAELTTLTGQIGALQTKLQQAALSKPQAAQLDALRKQTTLATLTAPQSRDLAAMQKKAAALTELQQQLDTLTGARGDLQKQLAGEHLRQSVLGQAGRMVEPLVRPLGWDWRIGCAAIASFPAREVVVGTLGVIYDLGKDVDEKSTPLREQIQGATWDGTNRHVFSVPVALSLMVFFALCAQCASTLIVLKRETNSWRWPAFTFVYMTTLAYVGALITYQVGIRLMG